MEVRLGQVIRSRNRIFSRPVWIQRIYLQEKFVFQGYLIVVSKLNKIYISELLQYFDIYGTIGWTISLDCDLGSCYQAIVHVFFFFLEKCNFISCAELSKYSPDSTAESTSDKFARDYRCHSYLYNTMHNGPTNIFNNLVLLLYSNHAETSSIIVDLIFLFSLFFFLFLTTLKWDPLDRTS